MKLQGKVAIITGAGRGLGRAGFAAYCASKGGLDALTLVLANEGRPHNIRVNTLNPGGAVATRPVLARGLFTSRDRLRPQVIRGAAVWLASEESAGGTGQTLRATDWNQEHGLGDANATGIS